MKAKNNKTETLVFRVTEQQKKEIEHKASDMSVSLSAYLSHLITDYEKQKKESQQASARIIEAVTQKEIVEKALLETQNDSKIVGNPAFTDLFEKVNGQELNGKIIRSKYELLGVLASGAQLTAQEDKTVVHTPIQVRPPVLEESVAKGLPDWIIAVGALGVVVLLITIFYGLRSREPMRGKNV